MRSRRRLATGDRLLARSGAPSAPLHYPLCAIRCSIPSQRGVALITAVLIVALATILAVSVGFKGYLDQRRTATTFALDQAFEVALGGEAWASDADHHRQ